MVTGLAVFAEYFKENTEAYILIGGAATDYWVSDYGSSFRLTKDLDIILVVEALDSDFIRKFWAFIADGNYKIWQKSTGEPCFYRFVSPETEGYPQQLEFFSRSIEITQKHENSRFTPIPVEDELSSLSAILMNEEYYQFTIEHSKTIDNLHIASQEALIILKINAFNDMNERRLNGIPVDSRDIKKHLNDVIKLVITLPEGTKLSLPESLKTDTVKFFELLHSFNPDFKGIGKSFFLDNFTKEKFIQRFDECFE